MKRIAILTLLFFIIDASVAQQYMPLPKENGKWCIEYNNHVIPPPPWWYTNYWEKYYDGDTIVQNHTYKRIIKIEYDIYCLSTVISGPEYIGAVRDDTLNKKVYYIPPGQTNEELIYDFSLREGDTLFSYLNYYQPLIIETFDSILIGQTYFRILCFPYGEGCLIEGVGTLTGLLEEFTAFEGGSSLCALFEDSTLIYPDFPCNLSFTDTCLSVGLSHNNLSQLFISLYPNPTSEYIIIKHSNINMPSSVQIHDMFGRKYSEVEAMEGQTQTSVNVSSCPPGIYIAVITSGQSVLARKKFVISR